MIALVAASLTPSLWFLAGWSIRWGVLIALLAAWLRWVPPRRAATRHLLCALALGAGLGLPLAPGWSVAWPGGTASIMNSPPAPPARPAPAQSSPPPVLTFEADPPILSTDPEPVEASVREAPISRPAPVPIARKRGDGGRMVAGAIGLVWLGGTLVVLVRLVVGRWVLARLRASARPLSAPARAIFEATCREAVLVDRPVRAATHPNIGSPVVLGGWGPTVLVPATWDDWPAEARRACLLHELAHLARRDDAWKLVAELARAPFWFHPGVAWLTTRLDREAELACDEATVALGVAPVALARLLLDCARQPHRLDPRGFTLGRQSLAFFTTDTVSTRISRLLEEDMPRTPIRPSKLRILGLTALVGGLALAIGGARTQAIEPVRPTAELPPAQAPLPTPPPPARQEPAPVATAVNLTVRDAEERPVPGATVLLRTRVKNRTNTHETIAEAQTDAAGLVRFERQTEPDDWLVIYKEGYCYVARKLMEDSGKPIAELRLSRGRTLAGIVQDSDRRPVEGAEVWIQMAAERVGDHSTRTKLTDLQIGFTNSPLQIRGTPLDARMITRTDREGRFRFDMLPDRPLLMFQISADGRAMVDAMAEAVATDEMARDMPLTTFILPLEGRVSGRVVSKIPGQPVHLLGVALRGMGPLPGPAGQVRTDAAGRFDFGRLPGMVVGQAITDAEGRFDFGRLPGTAVGLALTGVPADCPWTYRPVTGIVVKPGQTTEATIELIEGTVVTGSMVMPDGKPVAGLTVSADCSPVLSQLRPIETTTDASGEYEFRLPPGPVKIGINRFRTPYTLVGSDHSSREVDVPAGVATLSLPPIVLAPTLKLTGRVVDSADRPVIAAKLFVRGPRPFMLTQDQYSVVTDAQGRFTADKLSDGQAISAQPMTLQTKLADGRKVEVPVIPSKDGSEVTVRLTVALASGPNSPEPVAPARGDPVPPGPAEPVVPRASTLVPPRTPIPGLFTVLIQDETSRPVEGATVVVGTPSEADGRQVAQTGADGLARFNRQPKSGDGIVGYKPGRSFTTQNARLSSTLTNVTLTLPRPRVVIGAVVDAAGQPVEGAEVRVHLAQGGVNQFYFSSGFGPMVRGTALERGIMARTDREGRFRFESLPDGAEITLSASAVGKATLQAAPFSLISAGVGPFEVPARIVLPPEARVVGRVVARVPGVAVGRLPVILRGYAGRSTRVSLSGTATTDADGRFEIRGLAEGQANLFLDKLPADGPWAYRPARDVRLTAGGSASVEIELVEGVAVGGSVTTSDGKPLAGVAVSARQGGVSPQMPAPIVKTVTDAGGRYRFRFSPGEASLNVIREPIQPGAQPGELRQVATVPEGQPTLVVAPIVLQPAVVLAGRVSDATGAAIEGAKLFGWDRQGLALANGDRFFAVTDAAGRFRLEQLSHGPPIPAGSLVAVQVRLGDGREFDASAVARLGGSETTIKLPIFRDGGPQGPDPVAGDEVAGVVLDAGGRPIEGVLIGHAGRISTSPVLSDEQGRFRFKGPGTRRIEVRLSKDGWEPREILQWRVGQAGRVVVMDNRTYFEGRVVAPDGAPVANALIRADSGEKRMGNQGMMTECITAGRSGPDGRYRLYVEPGVYEFQLRVPGSGVLRLSGREIATDEAQALDLRLTPGARFQARVVDSQSGAAVAGFEIKDWRNPVLAGTSGADGTLQITDMMPGTFAFGPLRNETYARWWSDACTSEWSRYQKVSRVGDGFQRNFDDLDFDIQPGMAPVTIQVEPAVTIRGVVLDPDGKPVAGATVAPARTGSGNSLTGDTRFSVPTDQNGAFTTHLPASGDAEYNLVAHDGKIHEFRTWGNGVNLPFKTTPGQVLDGVTLHLTRPATVRGRVVDAATGQPIAGREVRASAADKRGNRYYDPATRTEADGTFTLRCVRPGDQLIQAAAVYLDTSVYPDGASLPLTLTEGATREGIVIKATQ